MIFSEETVQKRGIDEQGRKIAIDEISWYKHVQSLKFEAIPKIHSFEPFVMERIRVEIFGSTIALQCRRKSE